MPTFDDAYIQKLNKLYDKGVFVRAVIFTESTAPLVKKYWVDHSEAITFQENVYEPLHMLWQNIKMSSALDLEGAELSVSNLARKAEDYVETIDVKGNEIVVQLLHLSLLNTLTNFFERRFFVQAVRADVRTITFTIGRELGWSESEFDDIWGIAEQVYYNELVTGHDGDEERDLCDLAVLERREGFEYLQILLAEGRANFIPSGLKWRYVIDRPRNPVMLVSEPGNLIESSVISEPLQPDPFVNHMFCEYRDSDNRDLPNVVTLPDPDWIDSDPIISDSIKLETIRRESQADREAMYHRKKAALVRRHWEAQGLQQFLYAEPMQAVYFYYPTASHLRGYSGRVRGTNAALDEVILDRNLELEAGENYQIVVQHESGTVETRTIDTAAGNVGRVHVTVAFADAPVAGEAYSLDKINPDSRKAVLQNIEYSDGEPLRLTLSDYVPEVYTPDDLPAKSVRRFFDLVRMAPLPLRAVSVVEESSITRDGSHISTLIFDVTPGINNVTGQAQVAGPNSIILAVTEPAIYHVYNQWKVEITEGPGAGQTRKLISYDSARNAFTNTFWSEIPTSASLYKLTKDRFGELTGFKVELRGELDTNVALAYLASQPDLAGLGLTAEQGWFHYEQWGQFEGRTWPGALPGWIELKTFDGTRGEYHDRVETGLQNFRITPISHGTENKLARWIKSLTVHGDYGAPVPPVQVFLSSHLKNVTIDIHQQRPTAEDLAGFIVEFQYNNADTGGTWQVWKTISVPAPHDNAMSGVMVRRHVQSMSDLPYDTYIWAKVWSRDHTNNISEYFTATSNTVQLLQVANSDIGEGILTDLDSYALDSTIEKASTDPPLEIAQVSLLTTGRPLLLLAKAIIKCEEDPGSGGPFQLELRSGQDYATSVYLDMCAQSLDGGEDTTVVLQHVFWPAPGVYYIKVWLNEPTPSRTWSAKYRRLFILEIKDQAVTT